MNLSKLKEQLMLHEGENRLGSRHMPYECTAGALTIGYGRNLQEIGITTEEALLLLENDIKRCSRELDRAIPFWRMHDDVRQHVIIDMCFNIGISRLLKFRKMLAAYEVNDYKKAADEMVDSRWYKQVGTRAETLVRMMREGE